jgi:predicted ATPase/DNA-binding SARP family transcriptional activator
MIEVRLLGPVEAAADGQVLRLGGPKQRALLALLALAPGRPVSADRILDELWRGEPPEGAATTLRSYVSRLRRALGSGLVAAQAGGYALATDPEQLDTHRFERLLGQGRDALARGSAGLAAERLHAALALWRGDALADVADHGLLAAEAQRLDELRTTCTIERVEADLALGRHLELVPELQALVQAEPLRERVWRQLVLALYRSGRQAEALAAYREARTMLDRELGLEPGEELKELERAILRQEVAAPAPAVARHNLPAATTRIVGRARELAELAGLLREHRLITLTGMGGSGKTRLALETATRQADAWSGGVWLVDLTAVADPGLVPAIAGPALGVTEQSAADPLAAIVEHVRPLELLLVLDNCEHLADACAELAAELLRGCPQVRILATSRIPLQVPGELDFAVDPLTEDDAVRLFVERATAVRRGAADGEAAMTTIGTICRGLDCLPLAIELAAARAKALSPAEIAARLDDRFRFLRAWQRIADPRHRTLQTTMDWSYDLLADDERELLRRLSVFAGGATLDAIEDVCLGGDELLARLVDFSLVRVQDREQTRYVLLETVREYAQAKFAQDADAEAVRRRHAEHYLAVAESANLSVESLARGPQRHEPVLREQHNIRAALDWAAEADVALGLQLAVALENFWITQALVEGGSRLERLFGLAGDDVEPLLRARAARDRGSCFDVLDDHDRAAVWYGRSRELFAAAGDDLGVAALDFRFGIVARRRDNDTATTRRLWEHCLAVFQEKGDPIGELQVLTNLGELELFEGNREKGRELHARGIAMAHDVGWLWWEANGLLTLANLAVEEGDADETATQARRVLESALASENRQMTLNALALLARAAALRGDDERARTLWASVDATEDGPGRLGRFDREEYAAAMPAGPLPAPLPLEDAVALALSG